MLPNWGVRDEIMQRNTHGVLRKCSCSWPERMKLWLPFTRKYYIVQFIPGYNCFQGSFEFKIFQIKCLFDGLCLIRISGNLVFSSLKMVISVYIETYTPLSELLKKHTVKAVLALLAIKNLFKSIYLLAQALCFVQRRYFLKGCLGQSQINQRCINQTGSLAYLCNLV